MAASPVRSQRTLRLSLLISFPAESFFYHYLQGGFNSATALFLCLCNHLIILIYFALLCATFRQNLSSPFIVTLLKKQSILMHF